MKSQEKKCPRCNLDKYISSFNKTCRSKDGYDTYCRECRKQISAEYRNNNPKKFKEGIKTSRKKLRIDVLTAYGGKCSCCGESNIEFLTIDHINGDGKQHRAESTSPYHVYYDLKKRDYPKDAYRCLCMNCNWSIGIWGYCPHEKQAVIIDKMRISD